MFKQITLFRILVLLAIIGIAGGLWMSFVDTKPNPVLPPPREPSYSPYPNFIAGSGIIETETENINLGSYLPGIVDQIYVDAGQNVKKGDQLFSLDPRQINADIEIKQKQVEQAQANLRQAKTSLKDATDKFNLVKDHGETGAISKEEYIIRRNNVLLAESNMKSNQAALQTSEANLKAAFLDRELLTLYAPIDCKILQVNVHPGEYISNTNAIDPHVLLGGVTKYNIRVDIDENDAWRFKPNTKAVAFLRGNNQLKIELQYDHLEPYVVPKRNLSGSSTERIDVRVLQPVYSFDPSLVPSYIGQQVDVYIEVP